MADTEIMDAQIGDIYIDRMNRLWRVTNVVREPTVTVEEVEGRLYDPNRPQIYAGAAVAVMANQSILSPQPSRIEKTTLSRFIGDQIWSGWKRIWQHPLPEAGETVSSEKVMVP